MQKEDKARCRGNREVERCPCNYLPWPTHTFRNTPLLNIPSPSFFRGH